MILLEGIGNFLIHDYCRLCYADNNMQITYASFFRRFFAYILDIIICFYFFLPFLTIFVFFFGTLLSLPIRPAFDYIANLPNLLFNFVVFITYSIFFLYLFSTTPGKYLLHLRVTKENNAKLDFITALVRSLLQPLSLSLFGIGYVSMTKDDQKRAWHDKVAHTVVIKISEQLNIMKTILIAILIPLGLFGLMLIINLLKNNLIR